MPEIADSTRRFRLDDKVVVLTGASSGLGAQMTTALAGAGAKLVVTARRAAEWGRLGVRVNAVGPAFFPTRLSGFPEDPDQVAWIERHSALGRPGRIDELDGMIIYLASDASTYVTGQHFLVDGGWSVY